MPEVREEVTSAIFISFGDTPAAAKARFAASLRIKCHLKCASNHVPLNFPSQKGRCLAPKDYRCSKRCSTPLEKGPIMRWQVGNSTNGIRLSFTQLFQSSFRHKHNSYSSIRNLRAVRNANLKLLFWEKKSATTFVLLVPMVSTRGCSENGCSAITPGLHEKRLIVCLPFELLQYPWHLQENLNNDIISKNHDPHHFRMEHVCFFVQICPFVRLYSNQSEVIERQTQRFLWCRFSLHSWTINQLPLSLCLALQTVPEMQSHQSSAG